MGGFCFCARTIAGILPTICPLSAGSNGRGFTYSLSRQCRASSRDLLEEKVGEGAVAERGVVTNGRCTCNGEFNCFFFFAAAWSKPCIYITCNCEFNCFYLRWHGLNHAYILPVSVSSAGLFEVAWSETCIYITCNCEFNWFCLRWHGLKHAYILPVTVSSAGLFEVAWSEPCIYITCNCEFNWFYLRWHGLNHAYILPVTVSSTGFVWGCMVWNMHICSAQSKNRYNSRIVLRKVGILTLLRNVEILSLRNTILE